jgi:hypothetical protein
MKLNPTLTSDIKVSSRCNKDLNLKPQTMKLFKNIGENLHNHDLSNNFLGIRPPSHRQHKEK